MISKADVWEAVVKGHTLMPTTDQWMEVREYLIDLLNVFARYGMDDEAIEATHHIATLEDMYGWCASDQ